MKILFVTDLYPINTGEDTTPKTLHNFVIEWIKSGHQVDVIKPNFIFNSFLRGKHFYQTGFYEYESVRIFNVNYFTPFLFDVTGKLANVKNQANSILSWIASAFYFVKLRAMTFRKKKFDFASLRGGAKGADAAIQIEDYDVIVAHMPSGIIFANKLAEKYNKPLVCGVHSSDIEVLTSPIYSIYFKSQLTQGYKSAKKIACRSFVLQKKIGEILPDLAPKTFVASSGVKEVRLINNNAQPKPVLLPSSPLALKVIICANFIKRKNIDKLILAVQDIENVELKIIGAGKEEKALKNIA